MTLRNEGGSGRCLFERGGGVYLAVGAVLNGGALKCFHHMHVLWCCVLCGWVWVWFLLHPSLSWLLSEVCFGITVLLTAVSNVAVYLRYCVPMLPCRNKTSTICLRNAADS